MSAILALSYAILAEPEPLLEQMILLVENADHISTFLAILEQFTTLLENPTQPDKKTKTAAQDQSLSSR